MQNTEKPRTENAMTSHIQHTELFRLLDHTKSRISEMKTDPTANAMEIADLEKLAAKTRDHLIVANQGLVGSIAKKLQGNGLELADLMAEGIAGLVRAVDQFDCRLGNRFSTFAFQPIHGAIARALSKQSRTIRIPEGQQPHLRKLNAVKVKLSQKAGCEPSVEEIAQAMGVTAKRVRSLLQMQQAPISLQAPLGDEGGATIMDMIKDTNVPDPTDELDASSRYETLMEALRNLTARERGVIELRHGLGENRKHTLEEIAAMLGLTRERIRQIQQASENKIKQFYIARELKGLAQVIKSGADRKAGNPSDAPGAVKPSNPTFRDKQSRLKMRNMAGNPNHHIWRNNGSWYTNFEVVTSAGTIQRVRNPLYTKDELVARRRRDVILGLYNVPLASTAA
jgi:RNA polymerase sigma factor (sigma-70 family)